MIGQIWDVLDGIGTVSYPTSSSQSTMPKLICSTRATTALTDHSMSHTPSTSRLIDAGVQIGLSDNVDYNGAQQNATARFQFTIKNGWRHSAAQAFLKPAMKRANLTVMTKSVVSRILIKNDKAIGVTIDRKGKGLDISCSREVILSAGSFHSPQILMLSGIGPKSELEKHKIEIRKELQGVGQNLQDHLFYFVSGYTKDKIGFNHSASMVNQLKEGIKYFINKTGNPLTCSPLEAVSFFNLDNYNDRVNFQFHFAPFHIDDGRTADLYQFNTIPTKRDGYTVCPSLLHPKSRGHVRLNSVNPLDAPLIDPQFLSHEDDLKALVKGGRIALELMSQDALQKHSDGWTDITPDVSDDVLIQYIKRMVETIYHPVGTCKMGTDDLSVVDPELRVNGIDGLRVIDGSIMPREGG